VRLTHYRVDEHHSNPYGAWKRMGSPVAPGPEQYRELQAASELALLEAPRPASVTGGSLQLELTLPRQAVSLVLVEWEPTQPASSATASATAELGATGTGPGR